jgi:hypothetical protein
MKVGPVMVHHPANYLINRTNTVETLLEWCDLLNARWFSVRRRSRARGFTVIQPRERISRFANAWVKRSGEMLKACVRLWLIQTGLRLTLSEEHFHVAATCLFTHIKRNITESTAVMRKTIQLFGPFLMWRNFLAINTFLVIRQYKY